MVQKGEILNDKANQSAMCGKRVMENLVLSTKYGIWAQKRGAKMKTLFSTLLPVKDTLKQ